MHKWELRFSLRSSRQQKKKSSNHSLAPFSTLILHDVSKWFLQWFLSVHYTIYYNIIWGYACNIVITSTSCGITIIYKIYVPMTYVYTRPETDCYAVIFSTIIIPTSLCRYIACTTIYNIIYVSPRKYDYSILLFVYITPCTHIMPIHVILCTVYNIMYLYCVYILYTDTPTTSFSIYILST